MRIHTRVSNTHFGWGAVMFNKYSRNLAAIPRYVLLHRIKTQSVAEHSYYVSLYVAELIERYRPDWDAKKKYEAVRGALVHDIAEARLSDFPGPVKRAVVDARSLDKAEAAIRADMGYEWKEDADAKKLRKVADLIDELHYLTQEAALGNGTVHNIRNGVKSRLMRAWDVAGLPSYDLLVFLRSLSTFHDFHAFINDAPNVDDIAEFM